MKTKIQKEKGVEKTQFKSLNELFNFGKSKKYEVTTLSEYKKFISRMNIGDLQVHAVKLGLRPSRNRSMLEKNLLNTFSKYQASIVPPTSVSQPVKNEKQVMEILSRGK